MMIKASSFIGDFNIRDLSPSSYDLIIIFVVVDWDWIVDNVANFVDFSIDSVQKFSFFSFSLFLSLLVLCFEFQLFFAFVLFVSFLFAFNFVLDLIPFFFKSIKIVSDWN